MSRGWRRFESTRPADGRRRRRWTDSFSHPRDDLSDFHSLIAELLPVGPVGPGRTTPKGDDLCAGTPGANVPAPSWRYIAVSSG